MAFANTKLVAKSDRITIDGNEVSNAFRRFGFTSVDSEEDMSGFSETGVDETLPGARAQGFQGEMFYSEEIVAIIAPIWYDREVVSIEWQPNGLVDSGATVWYGNCTIGEFSPENTRGSASTSPFSAKTADANGIQYGAGT